MKDPNCTQCQEWEICPFHPTDEAPVTERRMTPAELACAQEYFAREMYREAYAKPKPWARGVGIQGLRLLGPDDPDVSSDLIYLDEATGGLVGVPVTWEPTALAARRGRA